MDAVPPRNESGTYTLCDVSDADFVTDFVVFKESKGLPTSYANILTTELEVRRTHVEQVLIGQPHPIFSRHAWP